MAGQRWVPWRACTGRGRRARARRRDRARTTAGEAGAADEAAEDKLSSDRPIARRWTALPMHDRKVAPLVLTDDHAPVDRLMSHILFDPDLAER